MAQSSMNLANTLHCPRSIESYSARKTEELLKYMDDLFSDFDDVVEKTLHRVGKDVPLFSAVSDIEKLRHAVDKSSLLIHLHKMQLEVLSRASQQKEHDMNALAEKSASHLETIDANLSANKSLPTLPDEVLSRIFMHLYRIEETRNIQMTTLRRLFEDGGTNIHLRRFIRECIPNAIATVNAFGSVHDSENHDLVGPHPSLFKMSRLDEDSRDLLKSKSTVIFASLRDSEEMMEAQQLPWHNLVLSTSLVYHGTFDAPLRTFVRGFSAKLVELDHLDIRSAQYLTRDEYDLSQIISFDDLSGHSGEQHQYPQSKLRTARSQLRLLPFIHPFLCNIAVLEVAVFTTSIPTVTTLLKWLVTYSSTLTSLTVINPAGLDESPQFTMEAHSSLERLADSDPASDATSLFSFLHLRELKVISFTECYAKEIIQRMDSPSLMRLSLAFQGCKCPIGDVFERVSASMLHGIFPKLEFISMRTKQRSREIQFLTDLRAQHDASESRWLLPVLNSIEIAIDDHRAGGTSSPRAVLLALAKLVASRLNASHGSASAINTVDILPKGFGLEISPEILNTLKLLVPNLIIRKT
ncbi:hypothetical protein SCHPADRAFT_993745 [Schizopora paradoxa]|uniref:Uncharacterized protein n=1 Tax=Schizopora paradoxa TaxID=27342 RepID=A0A0H2S2P0_9AGAM|nr:hypothetical protein SCHPADRAFT_993745 [Schizopora paradoxa]